MNLSLPQLGEIHSSDLTASCPRAAYHRLRSEVNREVGTALFRGLSAGIALERIHASLEVEACADAAQSFADSCVNEGLKKLAEEGRVPSDAILAGLGDIANEIAGVLEAYCRRLGPHFDRCSLIGVEVPVRMELGDGRPPFASHLDLAVHSPGTELLPEGMIVLDWKWTDAAPTQAFLDRSPQLAAYWLAPREGSYLADPALGLWESAPAYPRVGWVHLPNLRPVGRKTTYEDPETGESTTLSKGDERPLDKIVRWCRFRPESAATARFNLLHHVDMLRAGFFPQIPDKTGCHLCQSRDWCSSAAH